MNIVFLDCTQNYGYQFSASNTKMELLAKGLMLERNRCFIVNGIDGYRGIRRTEIRQIAGIGEVVTYPHRCIPFVGFVANIPSLVGSLKRMKSRDKNVIILSNVYFHIYFLYVLIGRLLGYKIITVSHEWLPTIKSRNWIKNILGVIYAKTFGWGIHAILPISHYIWQRVEHFGKPMLMTPVLAEYPTNIPLMKKTDNFVYCVYAQYYRVITMIIDGYKTYVNQTANPYSLTLILCGQDAQIEKVRKYICDNSLQSYVDIKTKLPYAELLYTYQSAKALLIPLNPYHEQDYARFSQKIAEYLSSGSPIISNNVGEIPFYFKNKEDMIFADYSVEGFAKAFRWVQENDTEAVEIGKRGFSKGTKEFNHVLFGKKFNAFLSNLYK